jgi:hypothetical protein
MGVFLRLGSRPGIRFFGQKATDHGVRPWKSDPKDYCWSQLVKMTEWASATEVSQVVPTEKPGDEL